MGEMAQDYDHDYDDDDTQDWVGLTKKEVLAISKINMNIIDMIYFVEAKVREKNYG